MQEKIKIYTDGAAKGNPGRAGWAVIIIDGNKIFELGGGVKHATNNQMELTAPIEALKYLKKNNLSQPSPGQERAKGEAVEIISDSKYVILGITEWIFNWQKNNWRNAEKKPVLNRKLWEELYKLTEDIRPRWTYIKGHNGDRWNERADEIATSFAEGVPVNLKK